MPLVRVQRRAAGSIAPPRCGVVGESRMSRSYRGAGAEWPRTTSRRAVNCVCHFRSRSETAQAAGSRQSRPAVSVSGGYGHQPRAAPARSLRRHPNGRRHSSGAHVSPECRKSLPAVCRRFACRQQRVGTGKVWRSGQGTILPLLTSGRHALYGHEKHNPRETRGLAPITKMRIRARVRQALFGLR